MSEKSTTQTEQQEIHQLYQSLEQEQPSSELDQRILAAAHKAVASTAASTAKVLPMKPNRRAWYVPVSYAAVIVISLSVVLRLLLEPEVLDREVVPELERSAPQAGRDNDKEPAAIMAPAAPMATTAMEAQLAPPESVKKTAKMQAVEARAKASKPAAKQPYSRPEMLRRASPAESDSSEKMQLQSAAGNRAAQDMTLDAAKEISRDARLDEMKRLLADSQYDQLHSKLRQFRQIYPDYVLPEELSAWEKQAASAAGD
ncbi:MAG: hypothetical protein OQL06_07255 [Gammaproteobacteria bacterium]|nr:hypothetical protein [Gammaproteobacteria bacterium]